MKVKAVRLYGKMDARYETFELRDINPDEILAKVICDGICMSTHKTYLQGTGRPGIPADIAVNPIILGHELAAEVVEVGAEVGHLYSPGDKFGVQCAMIIGGRGMAPGYSYAEFGGNATHIIVPADVLTTEYIIKFNDMAFYEASLGEPYACLLYAFNANFHTAPLKRNHEQGIKEGGCAAFLGGCGPMGQGGVELMLNMDRRPAFIAVTDVDKDRLEYAKKVIPPEYAKARGVRLEYFDSSDAAKSAAELKTATGGAGFDDIFIMCPVAAAIAQADSICGKNCCINFFSGPTDKNLSVPVNFYDVHYYGKRIIGTTSSGVIDMKEAMRMSAERRFRAEVMVTHIGGLNAALGATRDLPKLKGGKKLIYSNAELELTAIADFKLKGGPLFSGLGEICDKNGGLWCAEAERFLLANAPPVI